MKMFKFLMSLIAVAGSCMGLQAIDMTAFGLRERTVGAKPLAREPIVSDEEIQEIKSRIIELEQRRQAVIDAKYKQLEGSKVTADTLWTVEKNIAGLCGVDAAALVEDSLVGNLVEIDAVEVLAHFLTGDKGVVAAMKQAGKVTDIEVLDYADTLWSEQAAPTFKVFAVQQFGGKGEWKELASWGYEIGSKAVNMTEAQWKQQKDESDDAYLGRVYDALMIIVSDARRPNTKNETDEDWANRIARGNVAVLLGESIEAAKAYSERGIATKTVDAIESGAKSFWNKLTSIF